MYVICYTGGTCGDIVTTVIDSRDIELAQNRMSVHEQRSKFKKPHLFESDQQKDHYFADMEKQYRCLPSHDIEYHSRRSHNIIGIVVNDKTHAKWAAERFHRMHRPHVWQEMIAVCGAQTMNDYADIMIHFGNMIQTKTQKILRLERILEGHLITDLAEIVGPDITLDSEIYQQWLTAQNYPQ